jgi:hypothetical protein
MKSSYYFVLSVWFDHARTYLVCPSSRWQRVRTRRVVPTRTRIRTRKILPVGLPVPACG